MATPLPWSHSSLEGLDTCPRQYQEIKVLHNFQDQKNAASIWGDEVHQVFEQYIGDKGNTALPANMFHYSKYLQDYLERPGRTLVEQKYALDRNLKPCGFSEKNEDGTYKVWGRGIIDVLTLDRDVAFVDDHKTGKNRKKNMQQLIIFALLTFYHHPEINVCVCTFHWLQLGAKDSETFNRSQIPEMWDTLLAKLDQYKRCFHLGIFPAKASGLCKNHCAVNTCEYWGSGRR